MSETTSWIGRHPSADLYLEDDQISRRHTYLQAVEGRVFCIDLESRTRTLWGDQETDQSRGWLDPGQFIRIGPYRIHRSDQPPETPAAAGVTDPFDPGDEGDVGPYGLPQAGLELPFRVDGRSSTWMIDGHLALVGRSDRYQFLLNDNSISEYHACLVRTPLGIWVVDLAAREGVYVNGMRVRWAWLADGDNLRMGLFTTVLRYDTPPAGIGREDVPLVAGASPTSPTPATPGRALARTDGPRQSLAVRSGPRSTDLVRAKASLRSPPAAVRPAEAGKSEWEPVLPPGADMASVWQQQMQLIETFHQDMMSMVQMVMAMQRDHLSSVRHELERVQQLTRELTSLQARLDQSRGSAQAAPPPDSGRPAQASKPAARVDASHSKSGPAPRDSHPTGKNAERRPPTRAGHPGPKGRPEPVAEEPAPVNEGPPVPGDGPELYAYLAKRITEIQKERQGYWRRILGAING